jgi:hypothetical protein
MVRFVAGHKICPFNFQERRKKFTLIAGLLRTFSIIQGQASVYLIQFLTSVKIPDRRVREAPLVHTLELRALARYPLKIDSGMTRRTGQTSLFDSDIDEGHQQIASA